MAISTLCMSKGANILKLLGHETRLTILKILEDHDCCVCEFVEIFDVSQPAISQHIRKLRDVGLIEEERKGQWIYYALNKNSEYYPFIIQVLNLLPEQRETLKQLEDSDIRKKC